MSLLNSLNRKLIAAFLLLGLSPLLIFAFVSIQQSSAALEQQAFNQLTSIRNIKQQQISNFFAERQGDMGVLVDVVDTLRDEAFNKLDAIQALKQAQLSNYLNDMRQQLLVASSDPYLREALVSLNLSFLQSDNFIDNPRWLRRAAAYGPRFSEIVKSNGWYDLFLINPNGSIIYTDARESDLGMSIPASKLSKSGIGQAYKQAKTLKQGEVAVADYAPYSPSNGDPAGFMMTPVYQQDELKGYLALQMPLDKINQIMLRRDGMGETGESYLVGADNRMRSDSYLAPETHSVKASFNNNTTVNTKAINDALQGNSGYAVIQDYNNNPVLSSWDSIDLGNGIRWAMISEIDIAEAFSPTDSQGIDFYKKYIEKYGYYDLFLLDSSGYAFYTVTQEADYQTNFVDGKYASSNLGDLVRNVLQQKQFSLADFAPYAPSNGAPASFIAQPVLDNQGNIAMVVALQLSLDAINSIMQQRDGMGETGESYLVGADKRMRSDSYLDPEGHSVTASFAGNVANNGVDTEAVSRALAGNTEAKIITDYNGNQVLSAFTPIAVGDSQWAMIVEVDEAEAFATKHQLQMIAIMILIAAAVAITLVGSWLARSISRPIAAIAVDAEAVAKGDLTTRIVVTQNDEVGILQQSMADMVKGLRDTVANISDSASQQAAAAEELAATTEQTSQIVAQQHQSTDQVASAINEMTATVREVSQNTALAAEAASGAQKQVLSGSNVVDRTVGGIRSLAETLEGSMVMIKELEDGATNIAGILDVIKGIADQTNLLALNAAIEAARAGEQGRGFAVVADEVRSLAQSTQTSASEIESMIEKLQAGATNSAESMTQGVKQADTLATQAQEVTDALAEIRTSVDTIGDMNLQIASAAEEQSAVAEDIGSNAEEISNMSEQTGQGAQQIAATSEELAQLATSLNEQVSQFKV